MSTEQKKGGSIYVYSTLSAPQAYTVWKAAAGDGPRQVQHVINIAGGTGVADKVSLQTPRGVLTTITAEEYELLSKCDMFNRHVKAGFITAETSKAESVEDVAACLNKKDGGAQKTKADFAKAPETGAPKDK